MDVPGLNSGKFFDTFSMHFLYPTLTVILEHLDPTIYILLFVTL